VRTTIRLDDELLAEVKRLAADTGRSMSEIVEDAVRASLARRHEPRPERRVELPTFRGNGVRAGVDLNSWASLLDVMEEEDAPR